MAFISIYSSCISQNINNVTNWKLYKEITGLQIYTQEIACHDDQNGIHQQFIVFQFINTTSYTMNVSWQKELWYNDICQTCGKPSNNENTFNITLAPGESLEGNCDKTSHSGLKIFSNFLNTVRGSKLTKFEFKNLVVSFK
jgi:hypothetical protein